MYILEHSGENGNQNDHTEIKLKSIIEPVCEKTNNFGSDQV